LSFSRDVVVHDKVAAFRTSLEIKIPEQQTVVAKDSSIKLQATPPKRGDDYEKRSFQDLILMILIQV
jgi:hypothetical protein